MPVLFWLRCGRIAPRSVRLDEAGCRSFRTSCFLETGTAGYPPFQNLVSSHLEKSSIFHHNMDCLSNFKRFIKEKNKILVDYFPK